MDKMKKGLLGCDKKARKRPNAIRVQKASFAITPFGKNNARELGIRLQKFYRNEPGVPSHRTCSTLGNEQQVR